MSQPAERVRRRYVVHGRVQGVGYRMFAQARAEAHGVRGWVRNRPDGRSVELTAEAPPETLAAFERDLERGPGGAYVSKLERLEPSDNESYATFEIRWWGS